MSALSPAPGVRWANLLTPLESALTDCCLSYKQNAPVSPLESALTKTPGAGVPQNIRDTLRFRHHTRHVAPLSPVASLDCAYFPSPRGCTTPTRSRFSPRLPQTQLTRPLFSYSYKPRYPQPLSFHVHTKPPGPRSGGSRFLLLATRHSPLPTAPLFSYSYELLFPQLPCFDNHPNCPGVWGYPLPTTHVLARRSFTESASREGPLVSDHGRCRSGRRSRMSFRLSIARTFSIRADEAEAPRIGVMRSSALATTSSRVM